MPTLNIKGVPESLYRKLKKRAAEHRRSLNSEVLLCLEVAVAAETVDAKAALAKADGIRQALRIPRLTDARLRKAKAAGRR
jgi:plasmid stability protein